MHKILTIILWCCLLLPLLGMAQNDTVIFSANGGFYEDVFSLEMYNYYPQNHIRYTTNGNRPTAQSPLYEGAMTLDYSMYSTSDIYTIQISPDDLVYIPDSVQHCIVIRAAVFNENDSCISSVMTNSYFIHALGCNTYGLPAVSLCADSLDLFGFEQGIMVPGALFDSLNPYQTGNYYMHEREWERLAHVEFYEHDDNSGINQDCGLRTHGNLSRRYPSKGLKIYARKEYGKKRFNYDFFNDSFLRGYKHLVFKPFALGYPFAGTQDYTCNKLALRLGLPSSDSRPFILYLNGEYWGVYFLQEKMDEDFLEDHFETDPDNCNIIGDWNGTLECGNNVNFMQMMNWFQNLTLVDDEAYQHVCELIDIDNYIDYMVFETYIANWDWPFNNMRCWQEGNGKWKWIFFDGDAALISGGWDVFGNAAVYTPPSSWNNYPNAKLVFGKLLENSQFKEAFESRAMELSQGLLSYENTFPIHHDIVETLRPNVESHMHRFGIPASMSEWENGNAMIDGFLYSRFETFWDGWNVFVGLPQYSEERSSVFPNPFSDELHISIDTYNSGAHDIAIYDMLGRKVFSQQCRFAAGGNSVTINPQLPTGIYFLKVGSLTQKIICY